jgi:hypothetical protein
MSDTTEIAAEVVGTYPHHILLDSSERKLLRDAAEAIRSLGIAHGTFVDFGGRVCAAGALQHVQDNRARCSLVWTVLDDVVDHTYRMSVTDWNDEKDGNGAYVRTAEDVAVLFLAVADRAEKDTTS